MNELVVVKNENNHDASVKEMSHKSESMEIAYAAMNGDKTKAAGVKINLMRNILS